MGNKLSFEDMRQSIDAVNVFRNEVKKAKKATVIVKRVGTDRSNKYMCDFYIGHGRYDDANMPNIQISWPKEVDNQMYDLFDCEYVKMKHISNGYLLIYTENKAGEEIEIDLIV